MTCLATSLVNSVSESNYLIFSAIQEFPNKCGADEIMITQKANKARDHQYNYEFETSRNVEFHN